MTFIATSVEGQKEKQQMEIRKIKSVFIAIELRIDSIDLNICNYLAFGILSKFISMPQIHRLNKISQNF